MIRAFVDAPLEIGATLTLPAAAARHITLVLRRRVGDRLQLFNGKGGQFDAEITAVDRRAAHVRLLAFDAVDRESPLRLTLAQCISKGDRMDYTLQKAVELGVSNLVPLLSARSVVKLDSERWDKKLDHWRGVVVAACEQSMRNRLPPVAAPLRLESWIATTCGAGRYVLAPGRAAGLADLPPATEATLLVGPEGGLDSSEIAVAISSGFIPLSLGPRILRTETAGVAALAAMQALWGDLG
jgi:16S rRNA (uracil1498-N3)-methyltransferase